MPVRLTNRFSADRDMGPARVDTNFEDLRRWSTDVDATFSTVNTSIAGVAADLSSLSTFADALQTDINTNTVDIGTLQATQSLILDDIDANILAIAAAEDDITANAAQITGLNIRENAACILVNSGFNVATNTNTNVGFSTETYDPYGWHSGSSHLVTPNVAGYYTATAMLEHPTTGAGATRQICLIWANGSTVLGRSDMDGIGGYPRQTVHCPEFYLNGTSDTVSVLVFQNSGATKSMYCKLSVRLMNR